MLAQRYLNNVDGMYTCSDSIVRDSWGVDESKDVDGTSLEFSPSSPLLVGSPSLYAYKNNRGSQYGRAGAHPVMPVDKFNLLLPQKSLISLSHRTIVAL
jgi:hypothetical protein